MFWPTETHCSFSCRLYAPHGVSLRCLRLSQFTLRPTLLVSAAALCFIRASFSSGNGYRHFELSVSSTQPSQPNWSKWHSVLFISFYHQATSNLMSSTIVETKSRILSAFISNQNWQLPSSAVSHETYSLPTTWKAVRPAGNSGVFRPVYVSFSITIVNHIYYISYIII